MSPAPRPATDRFRTCPVTGLAVDRRSESLIKANAVIAVACLVIGVVAAIGLVLTRWQVVHLLPAPLYYRFLTLHGLNMLIFFLVFFVMAILYFAGPVVLKSRQPAPGVGWAAFALMVLGMGIANTMVIRGRADVLYTSYPPLRADPWYYFGILLYLVGALIATGLFFRALAVAKRERTYSGSVPLVTFGALAAAILAVIMLLHGIAAYLPTWLWSLHLASIDPEIYRVLWWGFGHASQQVNAAAMVSIWYLLAGLTVGGVVLSETTSRVAFVLYVLFLSIASAHHLLVDPGLGPSWKIWNTSYAMYLGVLASMIHGFTVPAGVELGQRLRGHTAGLFGWLRRAPWGDPGFSGLWISLVLFGFMGGITGVTIGAEPINLIAHNTLGVPGHLHATAVGGTALAFMAVTYYLLPLIFRKRVAFWGMARVQPYVFGLGTAVMAAGMIVQGFLGVPRRHWDTSFADAPFPVAVHPAVEPIQIVFGIGGLTAAVGALMYIVIAVGTVFFGKALTEADLASGARGIPQGVKRLPPQTHEGPEVTAVRARGVKGTVVLAGAFFLCFVLYYFANWKVLASLWNVG